MDVNMKFDGSVNSSNQKETESSHHQVPAQKLAKPIHLQRLEKALSLNLLVRQVESCIGNKSDLIKPEDSLLVPLSKQTTRNLKSRVYNVSKVKKSKKWLKNILLEKSSSEDSDQEDGTGNLNESLQEMLNFHKLSLKAKKSSENRTMFREYSSSLLASELNISETNLEPVKRKRPAKSKPKKRPRPPMFSESQQPVAASATSITASVKAEPETKPVLEEVVPLLTQIKIEPVDTIAPSTPLACISPALPCEPSAKRIKKESMVDEIIYDTCLPDEILQSESSLQSEAAPSRAPSVDG
ncbi:hypothetical protein HDE_00239 [Halotydeus destructor]|nr:hypothetical protein HDE_00239 [Halotydeus destructor]